MHYHGPRKTGSHLSSNVEWLGAHIRNTRGIWMPQVSTELITTTMAEINLSEGKKKCSYSIFNNLSLVTATERVSQENSTILLLVKNRQGMGVGAKASTESHLQDFPCSSLKKLN